MWQLSRQLIEVVSKKKVGIVRLSNLWTWNYHFYAWSPRFTIPTHTHIHTHSLTHIAKGIIWNNGSLRGLIACLTFTFFSSQHNFIIYKMDRTIPPCFSVVIRDDTDDLSQYEAMVHNQLLMYVTYYIRVAIKFAQKVAVWWGKNIGMSTVLALSDSNINCQLKLSHTEVSVFSSVN